MMDSSLTHRSCSSSSSLSRSRLKSRRGSKWLGCALMADTCHPFVRSVVVWRGWCVDLLFEKQGQTHRLIRQPTRSVNQSTNQSNKQLRRPPGLNNERRGPALQPTNQSVHSVPIHPSQATNNPSESTDKQSTCSVSAQALTPSPPTVLSQRPCPGSASMSDWSSRMEPVYTPVA